LHAAHDLDAVTVHHGVEIGGVGCEGAGHGEVSLFVQPLDCDMPRELAPC
jgi:hypothetical protein